MISADLIAFANRLADAAGVAIRPHFRTRLDVEAKADASPVPIADRAAATAMRPLIAAARPNDGIIGEEYGAPRDGAAPIWVVGPSDGPRRYNAGRPILERTDKIGEGRKG